MSRFAFPYGIRFQEDGRIEIFPAVEIFIFGRKGKGIRAIFHIDSGATTSILPVSDADALGITAYAGRKIIVRGFSGEPLIGYQYLAAIQLSGKKMKIPMIFVDHAMAPRILGREGIFPVFGVLFDEAKRRTAFLDVKTKRKIIDSCFRQ